MTFLFKGYMIRIGRGRRPSFSLTVTGLPFVPPPPPPAGDGDWSSSNFSLSSSSGALGAMY